MRPEQFCYWLKGFFELQEPQGLTDKQVEIIKEHLNKVFNKEPTYYDKNSLLVDYKPFYGSC